MNLQGSQNKKHSEINLGNQIWELSHKYLSDQAAIFERLWLFISSLPDDKEEQGWDVYGENAAYQRSSKGHLKNQLGAIGLGTEDELAHRVLS